MLKNAYYLQRSVQIQPKTSEICQNVENILANFRLRYRPEKNQAGRAFRGARPREELLRGGEDHGAGRGDGEGRDEVHEHDVELEVPDADAAQELLREAPDAWDKELSQNCIEIVTKF